MIRIENTTTAETLALLNRAVHDWHVINYPDIFKDNDAGLFQYFKTSLERKDCFHFIAFDETKPVGFIQTELRIHNDSPFQHPRKSFYINIVVVIPEYKNKGIGKILFENVFNLAKDNSIDRVEIDHWAGNEAGTIFSKLGFRPYRHYLGINLSDNKQSR